MVDRDVGRKVDRKGNAYTGRHLSMYIYIVVAFGGSTFHPTANPNSEDEFMITRPPVIYIYIYIYFFIPVYVQIHVHMWTAGSWIGRYKTHRR